MFAPRLIGKPVVVLSSNDGACIARSNEAKDIGVKMAQPWYQVRHLEKTAALGFAGAQAAETGRPSYHPRVLLKIYVYGYSNRVQSSRRLERECQRNLELMWLTGRLAPTSRLSPTSAATMAPASETPAGASSRCAASSGC